MPGPPLLAVDGLQTHVGSVSMWCAVCIVDWFVRITGRRGWTPGPTACCRSPQADDPLIVHLVRPSTPKASENGSTRPRRHLPETHPHVCAGR